MSRHEGNRAGAPLYNRARPAITLLATLTPGPTMTRILPHDHDHRFATRSVHAGQVPEPLAGAVMTPIYQTSTYVQEGLGRHKGYEYARTQNPTREALERNVAALEGAHPRLRLRLGARRARRPAQAAPQRRPRRLRRERLRRHATA